LVGSRRAPRQKAGGKRQEAGGRREVRFFHAFGYFSRAALA